VDEVDQAISALRLADYETADQILVKLGAGKHDAAPRIRVLWAVAQIMLRKFSDGVEALLDLSARSPNRNQPLYRRVEALVGSLDTLLPAAAAQEVRLRVGDYFLRAETADDAVDWLRAGLGAAPDDPLALYLDANCRFARYGDRQSVHDMEAVLDRAAGETERAYFIGGGVAALWYRLGIAHDRMRNLDRSAQYFARAVELAADNSAPRLMLGDVLIRLGRCEEAVEQLQAIPQYADNYRFAARLCAVALFRTGQTDEALALLKVVADLDPLDAVTFLELGRIYLTVGNGEQAEIALARAFRTSPDLPGLKSAILALERELGRPMDGDAGMPEITSIAIPSEFVPRPDDPALAHQPSLRAGTIGFSVALRTIMLRALLTNHEHSGIGYLWAVAQPLAFVAALDLVYAMGGHRMPYGTSSTAFLVAGIVPFICFYVRVQAAASVAVRGNLNFLYFRQVTPLLLILSGCLLEYLTGLVVLVMIIGGLSLYQGSLLLNDPLTMIAALTCISMLGMVVGTLFGLGQLVIPGISIIEVIFFRLMFFFSGALYYANMLPPRMRYYALFNPLLHLIEFVRDGIFESYHSRYANWHYPLTFVFVGLALMMAVIKATRRYVVAP
jgi:capsular polysaccharide transport system permease protein